MIRAILVDDEPLAREVLREYLAADEEFEIVAECANGFEAVRAVTQHDPDVVFLDIQMPKLDGFEVLELLDRVAEQPPAERHEAVTMQAWAQAVAGSVEEAVGTAKDIAGDRFVTIASADIIQQALTLGLVDELCISQVPVLFGSGIRYFGEFVGAHVMLEDPVVVQGTRALHLRYPVRR